MIEPHAFTADFTGRRKNKHKLVISDNITVVGHQGG